MKRNKLLIVSPRGAANELYLDKYTVKEYVKHRDNPNAWANTVTVSDLNKYHKKALHDACDSIYEYSKRKKWYTYDDIVQMINKLYTITLASY